MVRLFVTADEVMFGGCVPGDDLLRSKSLDRDSYNSGDHFNRVDWTGQDNNFGVGLPPASKNGGGWHYKQPLLANPLVKPTSEQICTATEIFQVMLRIRCDEWERAACLLEGTTDRGSPSHYIFSPLG
jgi:hypothetical protein